MLTSTSNADLLHAVLVPYLKNRDYVSRSDLLERVQEHLGFGQTLRRQGPRIAIHGLGGTG